MVQVARGRLSKQIAGDMGEATVKVHPSHAMRKMNARSLPEFGPNGGQARPPTREVAVLLGPRVVGRPVGGCVTHRCASAD